MSDLHLIVFDCDGTLIDSAAAIVHSMQTAFAAVDLAVPTDAEVRGIVGLSVPQAVEALAPGLDRETLYRIDQGFRAASLAHRAEHGASGADLYPGARTALERLDAQGALMAVATGKARRGLEYVFDTYDLRRFFVASQTADDAPSKPHPGMLENCERLTGAARMTVIGDTSFDMAMAKAYGARAIGVSWGYHDEDRLFATGADIVIHSFDDLHGVLEA